MKHLLTTSALALALGATAFAGPAGAVEREPSYCGQSWLQVDTNNDGKVTQSEAEAAFAREFSEMDKSGDEAVSFDEYMECQTSRVTMTPAQLQGDDEQGGGEQPLTDRKSAANAESQGKKSPIQAQTLQQVLRAADANKDGVLTRREYAMAARQAHERARNAQVDDAHRESVTDPSLIALRRFILLVPKDGENQAGHNQAGQQQDAARRLQAMSSDEAAARSAMKFGALDRDGDGTLAESEWDAAATDSMSSALAEEHFKAMDRNADGKLSREEYRNARDADMTEAEEAIQAWDEPQTLPEDASEQEAAQAGQQGSGQQDGAVPVYIFRFHTM